MLDETFLTTDDVALVPQLGKLQSRAEAQLYGFIFTSPMDTVTGVKMAEAVVSTGHFATVCRFLESEWFETLKLVERKTVEGEINFLSNVFFAIGSKEKETKQLEMDLALVPDLRSINLNIDVAHGDTNHMHALYRLYSSKPYVANLMSGSICTPEAAIRCFDSGCTHIRVGVGPGSACTTRLKTGCGIPQLSAVSMIHQALVEKGLRNKVKLIADGGVRSPGDAVKYLAAGADYIMMGRNFSSCPESPGWQHTKTNWWKKAILAKRYRGQASASFQEDLLGKTSDCPEGATGPLIHPGRSAESIIKEFEGGVRSALSYLGLETLNQLSPENVVFVKTTQSSLAEAMPHGTKQ